ncbi:MAG: 16S rRNA (cytosine(1402)-N(4))-methyltransferase RsmH [Ignavibacteriae bacterium]|nr:16S rRNA (cytosine(1402)-N(4))-methyltransferase RsmH [Ignavibacteriota bacterium]
MTHVYHTPVLVDEVIDFLHIQPDGVYVDGTLGDGGHAENILEKMSSNGKLIGFDVDAEALNVAMKRLARFGHQAVFVHDNYVNIDKYLEKFAVRRINGLLLDLGVSSHQLDEAARGFSFQKDERLDMRMNQKQSLDGWAVVNTYQQEQLADIFWKYGEEHHARKVAKHIVEERKRHPIDTTGQLVRCVESAIPKRFMQKSLARIFQGIRIEVNNELENLRTVLKKSLEVLANGGRIVVLSYHSLEDRIVKDFFRGKARSTIAAGSNLLPDQPTTPMLRILTKKPATPNAKEIKQNPRARSAKLRAAERVME